MKLKRLYSVKEYIATLDKEKITQEEIILSGADFNLYEIMYKILKNFSDKEVSAKIEKDTLVITFNNYLKQRIEKFIENIK